MHIREHINGEQKQRTYLRVRFREQFKPSKVQQTSLSSRNRNDIKIMESQLINTEDIDMLRLCAKMYTYVTEGVRQPRSKTYIGETQDNEWWNYETDAKLY